MSLYPDGHLMLGLSGRVSDLLPSDEAIPSDSLFGESGVNQGQIVGGQVKGYRADVFFQIGTAFLYRGWG